MDLTIVLPSYREAASLQSLLPELKLRAAELTSSCEIVIVDAHSPIDDTEQVCRLNGVRHVYRTGGNDYGDAVRTGIAQAKGRYIILMDADGSHNPIYLQDLWARRESFDIVIGSRYVHGGMTENPFILIAMSFAVNVAFRIAFQLKCRDVTNSFRLYRGDPLRALHLDSDDFDIVEEILIKLVAGAANATLTEVPINFERRKAGESKRNLREFAVSYVQTLLRLRRFRTAAQLEARRQKGHL
jgi:dolichol-phosphate mannosyltransferase